MVSSSREVLVKHYRKLGTAKADTNFDKEFEREIDAWAEGDGRVEEPKREDSSSKVLQGEFIRDGVRECVAKPKNRKSS